jgi:hypothetical protein
VENEVLLGQVPSLDVKNSRNFVYKIGSHSITVSTISATVFGYFFA